MRTRDDRWTAVDRYITDLFAPPDAALAGAAAALEQAGMPAISVPPNVGKLLQMLARLVGARTILEIGTLGGYSTIWLARGLAPGGRVITLEADPTHADVARGSIARAGLDREVDIRVGRALETLPRLAQEGAGPFDLIFIDADKVSYPEYLDWSIRLSRPGTLLIADNVVRDGAVSDPDSPDANVQGVRRFNALLAADPRVTATVLQTVGEKGYDGVAMALVN